MTFTCCVPLCKTTGKKVLHSFPKDEGLCMQWIAALKCWHLNQKTAYKTHYKVCRKHFRTEDIKLSNRLRKNVVPSMQLPSEKILSRTSGSLNIASTSSLSNGADFPMNKAADCIADNVEEWEVEIMNVDLVDIVMEVDDEEVNDEVQKEELISLEITPVDAANVEMVEDYLEDNEEEIDYNRIDDQINRSIDGGPVLTHKSNKVKRAVKRRTLRFNPGTNSSRIYDPVARRLRYQSARIKYLKQQIKELRQPFGTVYDALSTKLNPDQLNFIKLQIKNAGKKPRGKRFSFEHKCMALAIYKQSPKCYRFLSRMFDLPSKQTLNKHSAIIQFKVGINPKLMAYIKKTVSEMNDLDKNVMLSWDEMALTAHLDFAETMDYIDGFEDTSKERTNKFATHALVFMVRGIRAAFKQPVAYFLTENIKSEELKELIKLVIVAVFDTGMCYVL